LFPEGIADLERFFGSLRLVESSEPLPCSFELVPATFFHDGRQMGTERPLVATYDPASSLTPDAALHRLAKELQSVGHSSQPVVARSFLGLYALLDRPSNAKLTQLNRLLASISSAEVSQYLVAPFPAFPGLKSFVVDDFTMGPLDHDRLVYWCKRVSCDYFDRYPDRHRGRFAIQRSPSPIRLLDVPAYRSRVAHILAERLLSYYFQALSESLLADFRNDAWAAQEVLVAAGAPFIDLNQPRQWHGGEFIAIFRNIGAANAGFFCPLAHALNVDFAHIDERVPRVQQDLQSTYGFIHPAANEIGQTLRTFCRFVARGKLHEHEQRISEAFLHHVIALDLLFGDRDSATQTVARRTAVCALAGFGGSFQGALKEAKHLYDVRSRYVHRGAHVGLGDLKRVQALVDSVLACLLRLNGLPPTDPERQSITWWHRQLDYVAGALQAGRAIPTEDLTSLGLLVHHPGNDSS
jgi:hypothetical protein